MRFRRRRPPISPPLRFWPDAPRRHRPRRAGRLAALGVVGLVAWPALDPALLRAPAFLSTEPERVDAFFGRCRVDRTPACVVDGDTLRLGKRRIRIVGIDAPELDGQCPRERELAARSAARLQQLLNAGPFLMSTRLDQQRDRYGRELRSLWRERPGGAEQSIAAEMRSSGLAARYLGRKASWC